VLTTTQTAKRLGLSVQRVRALIKEGKLPAEKVGRDWVIREKDLKRVKVYGKAGRPVKHGKTNGLPAKSANPRR